MPLFHNLLDKKFGNLLVIGLDKKTKGGHFKWLCVCSCGKFKSIRGGSLTSGDSKSCGCLKGPSNSMRMSGTRFYHIWYKMKDRCRNKSYREFYLYGGRGIKYSKEWEEFKNFRNDMLGDYEKHCKRYGIKNTSIERMDNNGNYCKENCKWATSKEQANNRRPKSSFNRKISQKKP